jgi:glutamyl-tRNA(Gln) amidotransferase subunit E
VVVWGVESDTVTAAKEIQLRYADATEGIPHETRQALPDGCTDFERILPGPDRMYPDTDSPAQLVTRERVQNLLVELPDPPWRREPRYSAAGVSTETIHFLIRRGGARLVDRVVEETGFDLRRACLFFGEELKGLRRSDLAVDKITESRWCALFEQMRQLPVLWEARRQLVEGLVDEPKLSVEELIAKDHLGEEPSGWQTQVNEALSAATARGLEENKLFDTVMGQAMSVLRGRVPAVRVVHVIHELQARKNDNG